MTVTEINQSIGTHYQGLSTDTKPTGVVLNSTFREYDTQTEWITYDGTNWVLKEPWGEVQATPTTNTLLGRLNSMAGQLTSLIAAVATNGITRISETLADNATTTLTDASLGICYITCNGEYTMFAFFADGTIQELVMGSDNIAYSDSDENLCAYAVGTQVTIKNALGDEYDLKGFVVYLT